MKISLIKVTFAITLLGILLLLFLSTFSPQETTAISRISNKQLNKYVKLQAQIKTIKNFKQYNFILLTLKDSTGEIDAVLSNTLLNQTRIIENQTFIIIGKVQQYQNSLQIQVEKIYPNLP